MAHRWIAGYIGNYLGNYLGTGAAIPVVVVRPSTSGGYTPPRRESYTRPDGDWLPRIRREPVRKDPEQPREPERKIARPAAKTAGIVPARPPIFAGPSAAAFVARLQVPPKVVRGDDIGALLRALIDEERERRGQQVRDAAQHAADVAAERLAARRARDDREVVDLLTINVA